MKQLTEALLYESVVSTNILKGKCLDIGVYGEIHRIYVAVYAQKMVMDSRLHEKIRWKRNIVSEMYKKTVLKE